MELGAHFLHALGVEALLDDGGDESRELRLLPALLVGQLGVHKVQALERVVFLDATEHVYPAALAGVSLDSGGRVHDGQLLCVFGDGDGVAGNYSDDGKQRSGGLPALRAATGVIVSDIAGQLNHHLVGGAFAVEVTAREVRVPFGDAVVEERMEGGRHVGWKEVRRICDRENLEQLKDRDTGCWSSLPFLLFYIGDEEQGSSPHLSQSLSFHPLMRGSEGARRRGSRPGRIGIP